MKKNKLFALKITLGSLVALTPLTTLCAISPSTVSQKKLNIINVNDSIFNIQDGKLLGFKPGITKKEIQNYCVGGVLTLPACNTIGERAFDCSFNDLFTSIKIDISTTEILERAFYNVKEVTSIGWTDATGTKTNPTAADSALTSIGQSAFASAIKLQSFAFPKSVNNIDSHAFLNCKALTTLDFSSFLISDLKNVQIGTGAFNGTIKTSATIKLADDSYNTDEKNLSVGLFRSNLTVAGIGSNWTYPDIGGYHPPVDNYKPIPKSYLTIKEDTETSTFTLTGINERYLRLIHQYGFDTLYIGQGITSIDEEFDLLNSLDGTTVTNPLGIRKLWIDNGTIHELPEKLCINNNSTTFGNDKCLITARLPIDIASIGDYAFAGCTNLTSINLNNLTSLTYIGENAFGQCSNLTSFDGPALSSNDTDTKLYLKSNSASGLKIGKRAFIETKITNLKFGDASLYTIGDLAFAECEQLKIIDFSDLDYWYIEESGETKVDGSFAKLMTNTNVIFTDISAPSTEQQFDYNILLPKAKTSNDTYITPEIFMGGNKSTWSYRKYTGFYWLMNSENTTNAFGNWNLMTTGTIVWGGSTTLNGTAGTAGSDVNSWGFMVDGKKVTTPSSVRLEGVDTDLGISIDDNCKVCWSSSTPSGNYTFKVVMTQDSVDYKSTDIGLNLESSGELVVGGGTQNRTMQGSSYQGQDDDENYLTCVYDGQDVSDSATYEIVPVDCTIPEGAITIGRDSSNQHYVIQWDCNDVTADAEYKFKIKATYNGKTGITNQVYTWNYKMDIIITNPGRSYFPSYSCSYLDETALLCKKDVSSGKDISADTTFNIAEQTVSGTPVDYMSVVKKDNNSYIKGNFYSVTAASSQPHQIKYKIGASYNGASTTCSNYNTIDLNRKSETCPIDSIVYTWNATTNSLDGTFNLLRGTSAYPYHIWFDLNEWQGSTPSSNMSIKLTIPQQYYSSVTVDTRNLGYYRLYRDQITYSISSIRQSSTYSYILSSSITPSYLLSNKNAGFVFFTMGISPTYTATQDIPITISLGSFMYNS